MTTESRVSVDDAPTRWRLATGSNLTRDRRDLPPPTLEQLRKARSPHVDRRVEHGKIQHLAEGQVGPNPMRNTSQSITAVPKPRQEREQKSADTSTRLRPFFGYYGGKWRDAVKNYPEPRFDTIVEPFAGSAGYALRHAHKKIILCEIDPILAAVWKYLIEVKSEEIQAIPDIGPADSVDDLKVCQEAKWLVGFWLNRGTASPRKSPSKWMREGIRPGSFWGARVRETIASQLDAIRHWQVLHCSYDECPVEEPATWFIDPPYETAGKNYRYGSAQINYHSLAEWCKERPGQVIVCENEGATWLPFEPLAEVKTTRADRRSKEVVWISSQNDRPNVAWQEP